VDELELSPLMTALLRELPTPGTVWRGTKRDAWLAAFEAALDFTYPNKPEDGNVNATQIP